MGEGERRGCEAACFREIAEERLALGGFDLIAGGSFFFTGATGSLRRTLGEVAGSGDLAIPGQQIGIAVEKEVLEAGLPSGPAQLLLDDRRVMFEKGDVKKVEVKIGGLDVAGEGLIEKGMSLGELVLRQVLIDEVCVVLAIVGTQAERGLRLRETAGEVAQVAFDDGEVGVGRYLIGIGGDPGL